MIETKTCVSNAVIGCTVMFVKGDNLLIHETPKYDIKDLWYMKTIYNHALTDNTQGIGSKNVDIK